MEEQIYQKLIAAIGKTSLSERTVRGKAQRIAKKYSDNDSIADEIITDAVYDLKELEGQLSHDLAYQLEKQVAEKKKEWEKAQIQKPIQIPDIPEEIKTQLAEIDEFRKFKENFLAEQKAKADKEKEEKFTSDVKAKMRELGCDDIDITDLMILSNKLDMNKSVDDNANSMRDLYNKKVSERVESGIMPMSPASFTRANMTEEERAKALQADIKRMEESGIMRN